MTHCHPKKEIAMQTQMFSNEELVKKYGGEAKFAEVISRLEKEIWQGGEVICEIHVNGNYVSEADEKVIAEQTINQVNSLEVLTRRQDELVAVTLRTAIDWMPKLKQDSLILAKSFRLQETREIHEHFIQLLEGCHWLAESLMLLKPIIFKIILEEPFREDWRRAETFLSAVAKEALGAFEKRDFVLISDILEYDLTSSLDAWRTLLTQQEQIMKIIEL